MAHRFPGRPPGFDLSDSSTMAPSFGSLAEGDEAYRFAEALLDETMSMSMPMPMPMPMPMTRFPGRPPGSRQHPSFRQQQQQQQHDDAASHLDPSQVYEFCILKFLTLKGATTDSTRSDDVKIGFGNAGHAHNPTSYDPSGLPPYMYSKNDI